MMKMAQTVVQKQYIDYSSKDIIFNTLEGLKKNQCTIATIFPKSWQNENIFIHTAGMIHPSKYMNLRVFYKTNQWTLMKKKLWIP